MNCRIDEFSRAFFFIFSFLVQAVQIRLHATTISVLLAITVLVTLVMHAVYVAVILAPAVVNVTET